MSDTDVAAEVAELKDLLFACVERHQRVKAPKRRLTGRELYLEFCSCGWCGYPQREHQQCEVYKAMLRSMQKEEHPAFASEGIEPQP